MSILYVKLFTVTLALSVVVMLTALYFEKLVPAAIGKLCSSLSFVALAISVGALAHGVGRAFFVAFVLSLVGDLLLLGKSQRWLSLGIAAFLSAHLAFVGAFFVRGVQWSQAAIGLTCVLPVSVLIARWVLVHASHDMRPKVIAYVAVISVMVAAAAGTIPWLLGAAVLFYVSDICVARHRFVKPGYVNRLVGLPLYYGAQWMFALASTAV